MIAEIADFFRRATGPLGRAYWWPGRSREKSDAPGVLLVSFAQVDPKARHRLLTRYRRYRRQPLWDDARPSDGDLGRPDTWLAICYRVAVVLFRTASRWRDLATGKTSWASHLCECEGLARAHQAIMLGAPYHHLGDLHGRPLRDLRHLERLIKTLDHRRYEVWLVFRDRREAYVPASLAFPEVPLKVSEIEQLARHRCDPLPRVSGVRQLGPSDQTLRLMTYNVHGCVGLDGRLSVRRVAEVLARYNPHFVALQELDTGRRRSGFRDQLRELSQLWPSEPYFFPAMVKGQGAYGIGCLSRLPVLEWQGRKLPRARAVGSEPRVAIVARVKLPDGGNMVLVNTHLGLTRAERMAQIAGLEVLLDETEDPLVLLGDLNCPPRSKEMRRLLGRLQASCQVAPRTWFGSFPLRVLDYILLRRAGQVTKTFAPIDPLTVVASDHLPLLVDLELEGEHAGTVPSC